MIPLILTIAVATPAVAPPDGTYNYVSSMNGTPIGKTSIVVKRDDAGDIVLTETGAGSMSGQSGTIKDTLQLDPTLAPSAYASAASIAQGKSMKATVAFKGTQATQTGDITAKYDLAADAKHFVLLDLGPFSGFFVLPAQMQAWNNAPAIAVMPMYGRGFPMTPDTALKPDRPANVPPADSAISFSNMTQVTLWYDPKTLVVDQLDVPAQGVVVTRSP